MKLTSQLVKESILTLAKEIGLEENYNQIIKSGATLPKVSEMIVYELFVNDLDVQLASHGVEQAHVVLLAYCRELKSKGFVEFN